MLPTLKQKEKASHQHHAISHLDLIVPPVALSGTYDAGVHETEEEETADNCGQDKGNSSGGS
eukprot:9020390-Prorocentrum_lima.AAC.1